MASFDFKPPAHLSLQGNVAENWRTWKQQFQNFLTAKEADNKPDTVKIAMLLNCIGPESLERYNNFELEEGEGQTYNAVVSKFEKHYLGMKRTVFIRYQFWTCCKEEGQPFEDYLTHLKYLARQCDFAELDNMVRDKIVFSVKEKPLKERLLREDNPSLQKVKELCIAFEVTQQELKKMQPTSSSTHNTDQRVMAPIRVKKKRILVQEKHKKHCNACGSSNPPKQCPAYGKPCHKCKGKNHFATVCRTSSAKFKTRPRIHELEVEEESEEEYFWVGQIKSTGCEANTKRWSVEAQVCDSKIKMKVDTGAETSTIPTKQWESIKRKPRLRKARATLKAFGNTCIESEGTAIVPITVGYKKIMTKVFVTKGQTTAVLGLQACTKLGLVQKGKNGRCIQTNAISLEKEKRKVNITELLTTQDPTSDTMSYTYRSLINNKPLMLQVVLSLLDQDERVNMKLTTELSHASNFIAFRVQNTNLLGFCLSRTLYYSAGSQPLALVVDHVCTMSLLYLPWQHRECADVRYLTYPGSTKVRYLAFPGSTVSVLTSGTLLTLAALKSGTFLTLAAL
ncbi:Pol polyprotein [Elysia marginata]|uniref:Pol polyprotein n=1 Tax=Elysia marginata TaxID=1093978 RepID=A0AAV4ES20_9GAST|nr:Pol polyprotein [Elysia marginata]